MEALHLQQTILNKEILDYVVSKITQGQAQDAVIENLLGIGVAVVARVQSSQDVDFVKKEAQKIVSSFEGVVYNLQGELMTKVGETANQFSTLICKLLIPRNFLNHLTKWLVTSAERSCLSSKLSTNSLRKNSKASIKESQRHRTNLIQI